MYNQLQCLYVLYQTASELLQLHCDCCLQILCQLRSGSPRDLEEVLFELLCFASNLSLQMAFASCAFVLVV